MIRRLFQPKRANTITPNPRPLDGKTFLLGVGAQKSGTTWLYDYLKAHSACAVPRHKELHVFDAAFRPNLFRTFADDRVKELLDQLDRAEPEDRLHLTPTMRETMSIARAQLDPSSYAQIFAHIPTDAHLTCDITPEYAALEAEHFTRIREILTDSGARPRVVFLMRDPVERIYSAARMWGRRHKIEDQAEILDAMQRHLGLPAHQGRSRYDLTITALEAAFEPGEIYYGFYETMFSQQCLGTLCDFLGLSAEPAAFDTRVNVTKRQGALPEEVFDQTRQTLAPVYTFCQKRFGSALPDNWQL